MENPYHVGELKVQAKVGALEAAARVGRSIYPVIAHLFVDFIHSQPMVILGSADEKGRGWSSVLCGRPGFMTVVDEGTLRIDALPHETDPLHESLRDGKELGLLLIDFATRRRLRLNGSVRIEDDGFSLLPRQVYANCPRYIQARTLECVAAVRRPVPADARTDSLSEELQQWIRQADTFFLASFHPQGGADASHRGGFPGFVRVVDEGTIIWPEYNGNAMFNSLGNIHENSHAGLLFLDFEQGGTLQLSGSASIIWDEDRAAPFPGAERLVKFKISKVLKTEQATALRWKFIDYSPDNPWF